MKLLALLALGYLAIAGLLYLAQTWLLFPGAGRPSQRLEQPRPPERLVLASGDGAAELHGMLFAAPSADADLLIGFGGNGQDAESLAQDLVRDFPDLQVAVFHYRGYGPSTGTPGEAALLADALTIHDRLTQRLQPRRCFAIGISLGSAVAAYLSKKRPLAGILLVTPFDSVAAIAKESYFWLPVDLLLRHRFATIEFMAGNPTPVAVIAAERDRVVRPERTRALVDRLSNMVFYQVLTDAAHNTLYRLPNFEQVLRAAFAALRGAADRAGGDAQVLRSRGEPDR
jgi:alpha-beta hydrolase superfamily lysophospholipase